jgi:HEAT repeat protein
MEQVRRGPRGLQHAALFALGEFGGERASSALVEIVHEQPALAQAAVHALARTGSEEAQDLLMELAEDTAGGPLSLAALSSLTQSEGPEVEVLMKRALASADPQRTGLAVQYFAMRGNESVVPTLTKLAKEGGQHHAWTAVSALGQIGGEAARASLEQLAAGSGNTAHMALQTLSNLPGGNDAARRIALGKVQQGKLEGAGPWLEILSRDPSDEAASALIMAARSNDSALSAQAIGWLGQRRDAESMRALEELVSRGITPEQRVAALSGLSQSGHPSAHDYLRKAMQDQSPEVRAHAVRSLLESGAPDAESNLLAATRDTDPNVMQAASFALAELGTPSAFNRLEELASSGDGRFAPQALHALAGHAPARAASVAEAIAGGKDVQASLAAVQIAGMFPREVGIRIWASALRHADSARVPELINLIAQQGLGQSELSALVQPLRRDPRLSDDVRSALEIH